MRGLRPCHAVGIAISQDLCVLAILPACLRADAASRRSGGDLKSVDSTLKPRHAASGKLARLPLIQTIEGLEQHSK